MNSNFAARVAYSIYDTLVWRNYLSESDGSGAELVPGLATSWEQVSPTEWDFTIRQGVKSHDGTTMTTADVAFSINNTYGDGSEPFAASGTIASVVAVDANAVRITTKNPDPALLARMATVMGQSIRRPIMKALVRKSLAACQSEPDPTCGAAGLPGNPLP